MEELFSRRFIPAFTRVRRKWESTNWSFWLVTELYDYYQRSGDREFIDKYAYRIEPVYRGNADLTRRERPA